ncbi:myb/SANT-like DNA-binding domain-containing protein 3 [Plutella xylostella]|uniref:myb/SANT-like DNA-binding domain-containing protein 3 n=1 Tax=Plutella xylostella TaxID=51655 RepID=UPI002032888D|nr:myb/SANT-like DNA-binding domain-containing protein 3 [Plutella xylostella]
MSKRKRDPTFVFSEKMVLVDLVESHYSIVESKKTDAYSVREKAAEWAKIAEAFNSSSAVYHREWTVLKNCWENLKKKAKNVMTLVNQNHIKTGGGPHVKIEDDPIIDRVVGIIKPQVQGFVNIFDSDGSEVLASHPSQSQESHVAMASPSSSLEEDNLAASSSLATRYPLQDVSLLHTGSTNQKINWTHYTTKMIRNKKNPALRLSLEQNSNHDNDELSLTVPLTPNPLASPPPVIVTPARPSTSTQATSRRRPVLKLSQTESLAKQRIQTLLNANEQAKEQHEATMRILKIQEEQEMYKLEQEKLRVELLKAELANKLKNMD